MRYPVPFALLPAASAESVWVISHRPSAVYPTMFTIQGREVVDAS